MGIIRKIAFFSLLLYSLCLIILFSGCEALSFDSDINLCDIPLSEVYAHSGAAYYLGKDGSLYCTGADSDTSSFVTYQNSRKGIVAENVRSFCEIVGGGCYIDRSNNLYMWNDTLLPLYGYNQKAEHLKIIEDIRFVAAHLNCLIYIDAASNLYLAGRFNGQEYSIDSPKLLSTNVICADVSDRTLIWVDSNGSIGFYGQEDPDMLTTVKRHLPTLYITAIYLSTDYVAILCNNELWYYGDYKKLTTGDDSQVCELRCLSNNIIDFSCSPHTIVALNEKGEMLLWGRCVSNDAQNTNDPQFNYYERYCLTRNATDVFVSDSCICYIDKVGKSYIFYASGWPYFYGNATNDSCVGINRKPNTWIQ